MSRVKKSITELVGRTPLLELVNFEEHHELNARIIVKLEYYNPTNSVKDRIAVSMIEDAERRGVLKKGDTIVETTSGNTGIGLAAIAAAKGYGFRVYMQDGVSIERTKAIKAYGGEVIYFSQVPEIAGVMEATKGDFIAAIHALEKKLEAEESNLVFLNQIANSANPGVHRETTGPEIWEDTRGEIDLFVASVGTGGTISGAGAYLKSKNPGIKIVAVQPGPGSVPSEQNPQPAEITGVHKFTEIEDKRIPSTLDRTIYDEVYSVETPEAYEAARSAAKLDGILVGTSSGAAIYTALQLAKRPENKGKVIVAILPDTGLKYLSTDLFEV